MNNQESENTTTTSFYCPQCGHEIVIRHIRHEIDGDTPDPMDETRAKLLRQQFSEMVTACEKCACEAVRPWKITTGILAAAVVTLTLLSRN